MKVVPRKMASQWRMYDVTVDVLAKLVRRNRNANEPTLTNVAGRSDYGFRLSQVDSNLRVRAD